MRAVSNEHKEGKAVIYMVDDDGGFARAAGPRAQQYVKAMQTQPGWRIATKEEYEAARRAARK